MLRRTELRRKTPLQTHARQLPSGAGQLARVSPKRRRENRERTEALRPLRAAQPWCARCGATGVGLDGHELLSRARGGSITDPANIRLICRTCHQHITENPAAAEVEGWALPSRGAA